MLSISRLVCIGRLPLSQMHYFPSAAVAGRLSIWRSADRPQRQSHPQRFRSLAEERDQITLQRCRHQVYRPLVPDSKHSYHLWRPHLLQGMSTSPLLGPQKYGGAILEMADSNEHRHTLGLMMDQTKLAVQRRFDLNLYTSLLRALPRILWI